MNEFKNIKKYKIEPLDEDELLLAAYFCDEQGREWYEVRKGWDSAIAIIAVDADGMVCSVARSAI